MQLGAPGVLIGPAYSALSTGDRTTAYNSMLMSFCSRLACNTAASCNLLILAPVTPLCPVSLQCCSLVVRYWEPLSYSSPNHDHSQRRQSAGNSEASNFTIHGRSPPYTPLLLFVLTIPVPPAASALRTLFFFFAPAARLCARRVWWHYFLACFLSRGWLSPAPLFGPSQNRRLGYPFVPSAASWLSSLRRCCILSGSPASFAHHLGPSPPRATGGTLRYVEVNATAKAPHESLRPCSFTFSHLASIC
jgi:hypothetical protein